MLTPPETRRLLEDLCVRLGLCLPPAELQRLHQDTPTDVDSFVDAVVTAEGFDLLTIDRHLLRSVRGMVAAAFDRSSPRDHPTLE